MLTEWFTFTNINWILTCKFVFNDLVLNRLYLNSRKIIIFWKIKENNKLIQNARILFARIL